MNAISGLIRSTLGALALAALLVAPLGCAGVDEQGELVDEAAEALGAPLLVSSSVDFGTVAIGSVSMLNVKLTNIGSVRAVGITLAVPPDPYRTLHSPEADLGAEASSGAMAISFAPTAAGAFSRTLVVTYRDATAGGKLSTLSIPVTGTAK